MATATCRYCSWMAMHSADTGLEEAQFLRKRLIAHVEAEHPGILVVLLPGDVQRDDIDPEEDTNG